MLTSNLIENINDYQYQVPRPYMFKPDVIVSWPRNCDYPIWRYFIKTHRTLFDKVIVSFTETYQGYDYRDFIKTAMDKDDITFLQAPLPQGKQDWRDLSVTDALKYSHNSWVWFTEQDFLINGFNFWSEVYDKVEKKFDLIGITQSGRLHPACIFVKREVIDKTNRYFGIVEGKGDHFSVFQEDVERLKINRVYLANEEQYSYKHLNGFSHNFRLISEGKEPNYQVDEFLKYLQLSLEFEYLIPINAEYKLVALNIINAYKTN